MCVALGTWRLALGASCVCAVPASPQPAAAAATDVGDPWPADAVRWLPPASHAAGWLQWRRRWDAAARLPGHAAAGLRWVPAAGIRYAAAGIRHAAARIRWIRHAAARIRHATARIRHAAARIRWLPRIYPAGAARWGGPAAAAVEAEAAGFISRRRISVCHPVSRCGGTGTAGGTSRTGGGASCSWRSARLQRTVGRILRCAGQHRRRSRRWRRRAAVSCCCCCQCSDSGASGGGVLMARSMRPQLSRQFDTPPRADGHALPLQHSPTRSILLSSQRGRVIPAPLLQRPIAA